MPKPKLLLLDANIIILAHELGVWGQLVEKCSITITKTVYEEALFWDDADGERHDITLGPGIENGKINCLEVEMPVLETFLSKFGALYLDKLDPGEADSLALLTSSSDVWTICSADAIVFRVLGCLNLGDQGLSFEEVLRQVGLSVSLDEDCFHYTKDFRLKFTRRGQQEGIMGMGLRSENG